MSSVGKLHQTATVTFSQHLAIQLSDLPSERENKLHTHVAALFSSARLDTTCEPNLLKLIFL